MKKAFIILSCALIVFSCDYNIPSESEKENLQLIEKCSNQLQYFVESNQSLENAGTRIFPRSLNESGEIHYVGKRDWTSGFFPGVLWLMYDLTNNQQWKLEAEIYTEKLEEEQHNNSNHDIGFKMMSSYGQGYRLTKNNAYREILIQSARTLITRYNEKVGCIRSWDHHKDKWDYPVIIDNMINLELLFWASKETGDPVFANIASKHAETTLKNHFRDDFSSYHVVSYDTLTGAVEKKQTRQGFSDESSWARGQAWALYGYTMAYRETLNPDFLNQAEKIADYLFTVEKLQNDLIPIWDFDAPANSNEPKDVSAAAVIASALYELSTFSKVNSSNYLTQANTVMNSLSSSEYFNNLGTYGGFLLRHSTGSKPTDSEVDVPLVYADYYYLEALKRKIELDKLNKKLVNN